MIFDYFKVQVKIFEAKSLSGLGIEPFVEISVGNQKKHTTTKPQNNNPSWDEVKTVKETSLRNLKPGEQQLILTRKYFTYK